MSATVQGIRKGGRRCIDLRKNIRGRGPGSPVLWVGDVGNDTTHWEGVERIPPQGGPQAEGTEILEGKGWEVGIPPYG